MIKKYALVLIALLCFVWSGFGQIVVDNAATGVGGTIPSGWLGQNNVTTLSINQTGNGGYYLVQSSGSNYDYLLSNTYSSLNGRDVIIEFDIATYGNGTNSPLKVDLSNDGGTTWSGGTQTSFATPTSSSFISTSVNFNSISSSNVRFRFYDGVTGDKAVRIKNIVIKSISTDEVDWCNLQSPASGSMSVAGTYNVYAQVWEDTVTDADAFNPGVGITGEIGYSTTNSDPSGGGWTWVPANYLQDVGNNDEFIATFSGLASGTYYYASRFQYNGGPYKYGGYSTLNAGVTGGFWGEMNGTEINRNGILTVDQVDFCNLQFPEVGNIVSGGLFDVYARVYEPGITDASNIAPGAGIECWIGYSEIDATVGNSINNAATRADFASSDWTWVLAGYNQDYSNDDEFFVDIGSCLPPGNYVYASRFRLNGGAYSYGGITPPNGGSFWDGSTYISGVLTVTDPPLAEVVITEIMYNTSGTDDEWIEICNVSGSTQDISNYIIDVGGSTEFTFPCNTTLANGDCITIDLGDGGGPDYNVDCPFTSDYSNGSGTGTLNNTSDTITLFSANGTTVADRVTYDDGDDSSTDNNGSSYHIIDTSLDNSSTSSNWQSVAYGGSAGVNSLIPNCVPMIAEINVEGNLGLFPNIPDDDTSSNTPIGTNNTLFAAQFVGSTQSKSYRIQNLGGSNLNLTSVSIIGADPSEFNISVSPVSPVIYGTPSILEITFAPNTPGIKNAIVRILNNDDATDGDTEEVYTFNIRGEGLCVGVIDSITPTSGPEGTIVTIDATGINLSTASANFNGVPATIVNYIAVTDELEVTVPLGATDGNLEILDGFGCTGIIAFDVIDNQIGGCEGSTTLGELFISEVTDATYGGLSYVELYNATGGDVDLSNYRLELYQNGNTNTADTNNYKTQTLSGTIGNNQTYVIAIGNDNYDCPVPGGDGSYADLQLSIIGGINKPVNGHDYLSLFNNLTATIVDEFGVFGDNSWMDSVHTPISGTRGFNFRRLNTATPLPNQTFDDDDWLIIDWAGSGGGSCNVNDYSDIGIYDFSTGTPPNITVQPNFTVSSCDLTASISVTATEGFAGGNPLVYHWYFSAPGDLGWTALSDNTTYTGTTSPTLNIISTIGLDDYQYYCQVREDYASCYTASNAVQLHVQTAVWDGTWSSPPSSSKIVVINEDYDTSIEGPNNETSFEACQLIVTAGHLLTISDNKYVKVENNITIDGEIYVSSSGSLVQVNDLATVTLTNSNAKNTLSKFTHPLQNWYDYTYWSSPLEDAQIETALADSRYNRRYVYEANLFNDILIENANTGTFTSGQDDIDDDGNDWLNQPTGSMIPGVGYAATHNDIGFTTGTSYQYLFEGSLASGGAFNNGAINVDIYINPTVTYNNWNFIGNPYPSAISAQTFFEETASILEGVIYLWSQNTDADGNAPGNQNLNFSQDDYAMLNYVGGIAVGTSSPSGSSVPNGYVASGQGFFVIGNKSFAGSPGFYNQPIFNNSMRVTGNNDQFFRTTNLESNKLWLNLTSDNGVFSQILIGYVDGATDEIDAMAFDAPRNLSTGASSMLYAVIPNSDSKYAIQGKDSSSLTLDEVIPLGFYTSIEIATLYKLSIEQYEGEFMNENTIYLKDKLLNVIHDLSANDYSFTSEVGEFNNRFEIVFTTNSLSVDDYLIENTGLTIIERNNDQVQFTVNSSNLTIKNVEIIDLLGRTVYTFKGSSNTETFSLSNLSRSAYMARVTLSNNQVIVKKAIKK